MRTLLVALGLTLCTHGAVHGQQGAPGAGGDSLHRMSGTMGPARPATVDMGFLWRFKSGEGYVISRVREDSPASRAGLLEGDALIAIDGRDPAEEGAFFPNNAPGRRYRLRVQRGDRELELEIVSGPPRPRPST